MDAMQDLGERIRRVRGYTSQEAFARQLGISKGALGCYERGVNCPNVEVILNISRLRHVSLEWLMTGKGDMADAPGPAEPAPASCAPGLAAQPAGGWNRPAGKRTGPRRRMVRHRPARCDAQRPGQGALPAWLCRLEGPRRER